MSILPSLDGPIRDRRQSAQEASDIHRRLCALEVDAHEAGLEFIAHLIGIAALAAGGEQQSATRRPVDGSPSI